MLVISFLMESETVRECPASTDHLGGSFGLTASERAVWMRPAELSSMVLAEETIGPMALRPYERKSVTAGRRGPQQGRKAGELQATLLLPLTGPLCSHLWADLGRNGGKFRIGGKGGQVIHGLNEGSRGFTATLTVLGGESAIQSLSGRRPHPLSGCP